MSDYRAIDMMPGLRAKARNHPDFEVTDDGSITLKEGVTEASLESERFSF